MTPRSLQDALSLFFKSEQIEYTCEKCGHGKSDVTHKITRLPRVFILHLKRYSYNSVFSKHTKMGQNVSVSYVPYHAESLYRGNSTCLPSHIDGHLSK
ncbi:ubiquitin carboxyl-terminal hydrolase 37-like [Ruditapes philippinarum]|uniref:ubiquitin carboxyl-terminal hydrolase 37-like n=1 Tax=Ruditapes philippinarum TaxID=129788 RepID=UPI00295B6806|nr:ubiquitin carboxyl-terminal hydrolase 37-like [Ruditapes philippinarum]